MNFYLVFGNVLGLANIGFVRWPGIVRWRSRSRTEANSLAPALTTAKPSHAEQAKSTKSKKAFDRRSRSCRTAPSEQSSGGVNKAGPAALSFAPLELRSFTPPTFVCLCLAPASFIDEAGVEPRPINKVNLGGVNERSSDRRIKASIDWPRQL